MRQESIVWPLHPPTDGHTQAEAPSLCYWNERLIDLTLTHGSRKFCSAQTVGGGDVVLGGFRNIYLERHAPEYSQCLFKPRLRWEPSLFQVSGDNGSSCEFTTLCVPFIHSWAGEERKRAALWDYWAVLQEYTDLHHPKATSFSCLIFWMEGVWGWRGAPWPNMCFCIELDTGTFHSAHLHKKQFCGIQELSAALRDVYRSVLKVLYLKMRTKKMLFSIIQPSYSQDTWAQKGLNGDGFHIMSVFLYHDYLCLILSHRWSSDLISFAQMSFLTYIHNTVWFLCHNFVTVV